MGKVCVTEEYLQDIADAIREQGVSGTFTPAQMGDAVRAIEGGGDDGLLTANGPYVDTGVLGSTSGLKIQVSIRVTYTGEQAIFGASWGINGYFLMTYNNAFRFHSGGAVVDSAQIVNGDLYNIETTKTGMTINGVNYALANPSGNDDNANVLLFNTNNAQGNRTSGILYSCKIYDGDTLLRDFVPAVDNNDVACLHDSVSDTYFYNAGTGSFFIV